MADILLQIDDELFESYEEEIFYECYDCNWSGEDPFKQPSDLWPDEIILICPVCGQLLND